MAKHKLWLNRFIWLAAAFIAVGLLLASTGRRVLMNPSRRLKHTA